MRGFYSVCKNKNRGAGLDYNPEMYIWKKTLY